MPEAEPSPTELRAAVKDCYYAATQCASYHHWVRIVAPVLVQADASQQTDLNGFFANSEIEAVLLFFRKAHEFFKSRGDKDQPDTLYAYRWSYPNVGPIYSTELLKELHKRVGHITVREARYGKFPWNIHDMALAAYTRWIDFFNFLSEQTYANDAEIRQFCIDSRRSLEITVERLKRQFAEQSATQIPRAPQ